MYFLLIYKAVENFVEKRQPHGETHLAHARAAHERGELLVAGALDQPPDGAVLVFEGEDNRLAVEFANQDPYVQAGLITEWTVRPWTVVFGGEISVD